MENFPESLKIEDKDFLACLNNIKQYLNRLWNPQLLTHYTEHGLQHSQRIIDILGELLKEHIDLLNEQERFILLAAVYLHDIGMQAPILAGLKDKTDYDFNDSEIVREKHNETSAKMIRGEIPDTSLGLTLCSDYINSIATVSEYHRKLNINDLNTKSIAGKDIRLKLLAALLRLGDELDLDFRRVNIESLNIREIPIESKFFWFSHYFVQSVQIEHGKIKLWFRFPDIYKEKEQLIDVFTHKVYESVKKQFIEVYDIIDEYGLRLYRDIVIENPEFYSEGQLKPIPNDLERYIERYILKTLEISKKLNEQSEVSWEIDGILYSDDVKVSHCLENIFRLIENNDFKKAIKLVNKGQVLTMAPKEKLEFSIIAGNCNYFVGDLNKAEYHYNDVLELSSSKKLNDIYGNTILSIKSASLGNLGIVYREKGNFNLAIEFLTKAKTISEMIKDKLGNAIHLGNIGIVYIDKGDLKKALEHFNKSYTLAEQIGYKKGLANNLGNMGIVYRAKGNLDTAFEYFKESLKIYNETDNRRGKSITFSNIGGILILKGDSNKALGCFNESLDINREIGYKIGEANSLGSMGLIYKEKGDLEASLGCFNESLDINREIGYKIGEASELGNIGLIYKDKGENKTAFEYLMKALEINRQINYLLGEASNLGNIGELYSNMGDYDNALINLESAMKINKAQGFELQYCNNLLSMGIVYIHKGDLGRALTLLEESLEINQRIGYKHSEAVNLEYLGVLYSLKGEVNPALNFFVKSCNINKEIGNILGEATVLGNLGVLYAKEDPNKAIKFFKKALKIIDRIGVTDLQIQTLTNIAVIYFAIDNYEDGFKFLGQSLSISLPLQLNDIQYRLLIETIIKLNNRKDWNALKKIEVLYKSQYIIDERLVNLFKAIRSYSLTQLDVITNDEFIKIYDSLDPKSKIIFDYLIEFTQ